jgi:hypothetical protein
MEVILARGKAPLSKLIMWLTGGGYSHTALRYGGAESEWLVHAFIYGVVPEWYSYFKDNYLAIRSFKVIKYEAEAEKALDIVVMRYRHRKYDYLALFGYAISILLSKVRINIKPPFGKRTSFMCTEFVAEWLYEFAKQADICMADIRQWVITPQTLEAMMMTYPDIFQVTEGHHDSK